MTLSPAAAQIYRTFPLEERSWPTPSANFMGWNTPGWECGYLNGETPDGKNDGLVLNQVHAAVDFGAAGQRLVVVAPIDGYITYVRRPTSGTPTRNNFNSFVIFHGIDGYDYVLGHVECDATLCTATSTRSDGESYQTGDNVAARHSVTQGQRIGLLLGSVGTFPAHLHLGVTRTQMVSNLGILNSSFHGARWGIEEYSTRPLQNARDALLANGFLDPASLFGALPSSCVIPPPQPAANDNFDDASQIQYPGVLVGNNYGATRQDGEPRVDDSTAHDTSLWYRYRNASGRAIRISTHGDVETVISVYHGATLGTLLRVTESRATPRLLPNDGRAYDNDVVFYAFADEEYRISVAGRDGRVGSFWGTVNEEFGGQCRVTLSATAEACEMSVTVLTGPATSTLGQSPTFSAGVTINRGTPTGDVVFYRNGMQIGSSSLNDGGASFVAHNLPAGVSQITAEYLGEGSILGSMSPVLVHTVTQPSRIPTFISIGGPDYSTPGQNVEFVAAVTSGNGVPSGNVSFRRDGVELASGVLDNSGIARVTTSTLPSGSHTLTAVYQGSTLHGPSTSASIVHIVQNGLVSTSTSLSINPETVDEGDRVSFLAAVGSTSGTPGGTISFRRNSVEFASGTLNQYGIAQVYSSSMPVGTHPITAVYLGSVSYRTSTSDTAQLVVRANSNGRPPNDHFANRIVIPPTASVSGSNVNATSEAGEPLIFNVANTMRSVWWSFQATTSGDWIVDTTGSDFYVAQAIYTGNTVTSLTRLTSTSGEGGARLGFPVVAGQNYQIQIAGYPNHSGRIALSIGPNPGGGTIVPRVWRWEGNNSVSLLGTSVEFGISVSDPDIDNGGTPTGTIQLFNADNDVQIATAALRFGGASFAFETLPLGEHSYYARYLGDGSYTPGRSEVFGHFVSAAPLPTVTTLSGASRVAPNEPFVLLIEVSAAYGTPDRVVQVYRDGQFVNAYYLENGQIAVTFNDLVLGNHEFRARYVATEPYYDTSPWETFNVLVAQSLVPSTTTISGPSGQHVLGETLMYRVDVNSAQGVPDGQVDFMRNGVPFASGTLDANGEVTVSVSDFGIGDYQVQAAYLGSGSYEPSASNALAMNIVARSETTLIGPENVEWPEGATYVARVRSNSGQPLGTVSFRRNGSELATRQVDADGSATLSNVGMSVGTHQISAVYLGSADYLTSASAVIRTTISATPSITISGPATLNLGEAGTFIATVTSPAGTVPGNVRFRRNGTEVAIAPLSPDGTATAIFGSPNARFTTGTLRIVVDFLGSAGFQPVSSIELIVTITDTETTTVLTGPTSSQEGTDVTFEARVSSADRSPVGHVRFERNGRLIAMSRLRDGLASVVVPNLPIGNHRISAVFMGALEIALGSNAFASSRALDLEHEVTLRQPNRVIQIAAGSAHSCALFAGGEVYCWGANSDGQLGDATRQDRWSPVLVEGLAPITSISAGGNHTCAVASEGNVYCWGSNEFGQLGDGTAVGSDTPVSVPRLSNVVVLAAGRSHSCAVDQRGRVYCWGGNAAGQLGDGTTVNRSRPVRVRFLGRASILAAGGEHSCAIQSRSQRAFCWGSNQDSQLGNGATIDRLAPVRVVGRARLNALAAGTGHTCALDVDNNIACWGQNSAEQPDRVIGERQRSRRVNSVIAQTNSIAAGNGYSCAIFESNRVECWGESEFVQIDSRPPDDATEEMASGDNGFLAVAAGASHACVIDSSERVLCWGRNTHGQLGDGTIEDRMLLVEVGF